jgi:uroporphyrinogen III methyltransferase / synthase
VSGRPLAGCSVVVTRARGQAARMVERLTSLGASVVELPVIATEEAADGGVAFAGAVGRLLQGRYAWVALTSVNAANRLLEQLGPDPGTVPVKWAALGGGTASVLRSAGIEPAVVADVSTSAGLVEAFPPAPPPPAPAGAGASEDDPARTVFFPRAETVRGALAAGLRDRGWAVEEVVAYRTVAAVPPPESVERARHADAIAFTSSSTVEHTVRVLGIDGVPATIASIGPSTSATARQAGLEVHVEADPHTVDGLVDALARVLGRTPHVVAPAPRARNGRGGGRGDESRGPAR